MTLKPYPNYKDSGVEWLGKVPEHWEVKPVAVLFRRSKVTGKENEELLSVYRDFGVVPKSSRDDNFNKESDDLSSYQLVEELDLVTNKMKTWQGSIAISNHRGIVSPAYFVFKSTHHENSLYLHHLFRCDKYVCGYMSASKGIRVNQWDLDPDLFRRFPVLIPPIQEQTAIATYLNQETARIDELIAHKTRFIELLKEKRSALITHAVIKGLNPNVKMKDSGVEWLGQVPEHWEVKRLKFVATYQNSNVDKKTYDDQKLVRLCNYTDVYYNEFITDSMDFMEATASDSEVKSFSLEQGNIIITKDSEDPTDIGIPAIVAEPLFNVVCGYHLTIIRTTKDNCASFVFRVLQSHPTKAQFYVESPGITRFGLGQDTIGGLSFALPPIAEQTAIATYLDQETARIDKLVQLTEQSISLIKERRSALITAAVTGKVDVQEYNTQKELV